MGLDRTALMLLKAALPAKQVLSLGYPDILLSCQDVNEFFHIEIDKIAPQNEEAKKRHGVAFDLPDTEAFFSALGSVLTCVDYKQLRGNEIVADLNEPNEFGLFDLVIDPGTLEHCFNIAQAACNAAKAVAENGFILHVNPISQVNHGFYMLSPTWYHDFYTQNGWKVPRMLVSDGKNISQIDPVRRVSVLSNLSNYILVSRGLASNQMHWPIQSKYLKMLA